MPVKCPGLTSLTLREILYGYFWKVSFYLRRGEMYIFYFWLLFVCGTLMWQQPSLVHELTLEHKLTAELKERWKDGMFDDIVELLN